MSSILGRSIKQNGSLTLYKQGEIAMIEMNDGQNRINHDFLDAFTALLDEVERTESFKGLITTGKGKFFSNGLDLEWMGSLPAQEIQSFIARFISFLKRLTCFPLPTLAAINGHAFAGGAMIAFAHDVRTMQTEKGWICLNEVHIGRTFHPLMMQFLRNKLGHGPRFCDTLVLGRRYTAKQAVEAGYVHSMQPLSVLIPESLHVLKSFYGKGIQRESMAAMKADVFAPMIEAENAKSKL